MLTKKLNFYKIQDTFDKIDQIGLLLEYQMYQDEIELYRQNIDTDVLSIVEDANDYTQDDNTYDKGGELDLTPWKALLNINYETVPDTSFTRDKTKQGDIDVFSAENLGNYYDFDKNTKQYRYYKLNPIPGKDVILYNPNTNDEQDVRLDVLHLMPKLDDTYNTLNLLYREAAKNGDPGYWARLYYKQDVKEKGKDNIDSEEQYFNNEADGLLRNMFIEGSPEYIESKRYRSDKNNLIKENEYLMPYINNILWYLESGLRPEWIQTRDDNGNILNSILLDEIIKTNQK